MAALVAVAAVVPTGPHLTPDSLSYLAFADRGLDAYGHQYVWWPPLYPWLIALHPAALTVAVNAVGAAATSSGVAVAVADVTDERAAPWLAGTLSLPRGRWCTW